MLDNQTFSVHLHLYYKDSSILLLNKISKAWNGKVYISLVSGNENNDNIVCVAKSLFSDVVVIENENRANDQYGFYKSFQQNNDNTEWIFYAHDKHKSKIEWMNNLLDPIVDQTESVNCLAKNNEIGLIASKCDRYITETLQEERLNMYSDTCKPDERLKIILSRHTLMWLRELQAELVRQNNLESIHDPRSLWFVAGNIFIMRREILKKCHSCVHENFFDKYYKPDGDIGHGLERFYFYAPLCFDFHIKLIGEHV